MSRSPATNDFVVDVDGVGAFTFGYRKLADEVRIQVEYARLTEGVTPTDWLALVATWLAALKVLTVRAPDGWDTEELDPLDTDTYNKLLKVYTALVAKEGDFRKKPSKSGEVGGKEPGVNA